MTKDTMEMLVGKIYYIQGEVRDLDFERVCFIQGEVDSICEFIGEFAKELEKELEGIVDDEE